MTIGYAQEIPGGYVFEIGNEWISRRIHCIGGRIGTTSLVNVLHGEEYLEETLAEFEIVLAGEGQRVTFDHKDFKLTGYQTPNWDDSIRTLQLQLEVDVNDTKLPISVFYEIRGADRYMRKWITVEPCDLENWSVRQVTLEKMKFREMVEGVVPQPRYPQKYANSEDKVHTDPDKVDTGHPESRLQFGDTARAVVSLWGYGEGLYFFTESLTGEEVFYRPTGLAMKHKDCTPLTEGMTTGSAVIGAYSGPPEIGLKRYREHLLDHWCVIGDKSVPVTWNTWLVTLEDNKPVHTNYSRDFLFQAIEQLKEAGFYEALHLDLGWEAQYPLSYDESKFPNGLSEIARRAKEAAGLDMTYWVNPFSCSYWKSELQDEHPEYTVPGKVSGRSKASAMCVMTEYYDYVRQRMIDLAVGLNARAIYWDGNDWNIPECTSNHHEHRDQEELQIKATRRLADICAAAHDARPDLILFAFSLPFDNHRLCALDAQTIADTHTFPTVQSELIQRQQMYQMTFEHPYRAIWSSWYGVNWHEAGDSNLTKRPLRELMHAEMSMIGNGFAQAGASIDLQQARPEFVDFLGKLAAFRKRFEKYFNAYQHVLGFPDGKHIDGEGHIVDGSGFIVLVNPTEENQTVRLPLDEPELELIPGKKYQLSDWSALTRGIPLDPAIFRQGDAIHHEHHHHHDDECECDECGHDHDHEDDLGHVEFDTPAHASGLPEFELAPLEVRFIGVNVGVGD